MCWVSSQFPYHLFVATLLILKRMLKLIVSFIAQILVDMQLVEMISLVELRHAKCEYWFSRRHCLDLLSHAKA